MFAVIAVYIYVKLILKKNSGLPLTYRLHRWLGLRNFISDVWIYDLLYIKIGVLKHVESISEVILAAPAEKAPRRGQGWVNTLQHILKLQYNNLIDFVMVYYTKLRSSKISYMIWVQVNNTYIHIRYIYAVWSTSIHQNNNKTSAP